MFVIVEVTVKPSYCSNDTIAKLSKKRKISHRQS